ncbi:armadillo-type protein [Peziza echinospora]|nr:armadillo-type protein [Peziza echinospora]
MLPVRTRTQTPAAVAATYSQHDQMSLERQPYEELCSNIRARPIGWVGYQRAGTITADEVERIKAIDKVSPEKRVELVSQDSAGYAKLFLGDGGAEKGILGRIGASRDGGDIIQYILVLMGDLLENIPQFAQALLAVPKPFTRLLPLLSHTDVNVPVFTSRVLTTLLSVSLNTAQGEPSEHIQEALPTYLSYLATLIKSNDTYLQDVGVQSYVTLFRSGYARITFWNSGAEGLDPLIAILQTAARGSASSGSANSGSTNLGGLIQGGVGLQLLYHVLLVVWELTFEEVIAEEIHPKYDLIPTLTLIIRSALKEKIARISTAILYNLATKSPSVNLSPLLVSNSLPLLQSTSQRFTSDPDLTADLTYLIETLENYQRSQTTFDEYAAEVRSGHLRWSPPHKNTDFWKKNARRIVEEGQGELMKALATALSGGAAASTPDAKTVLAVAAHDVGVLVREVPEKRKVWEQLGVKARVMELIGDTDASVRYEALTAVRGFLEHAFS